MHISIYTYKADDESMKTIQNSSLNIIKQINANVNTNVNTDVGVKKHVNTNSDTPVNSHINKNKLIHIYI